MNRGPDLFTVVCATSRSTLSDSPGREAKSPGVGRSPAKPTVSKSRSASRVRLHREPMSAIRPGMRERETLFELPDPVALRRDTGAWQKAELRRFTELAELHGGLMTPAVAAEFMGLSKQRIGQFMASGLLQRFEVAERCYVSGNEVCDLMTRHRPSHRPARKKGCIKSCHAVSVPRRTALL